MYSNGTVLAVLRFHEGVARPPAALQIYTRIYIPRERPFRSHSNSSFCLLSGCRDFLRDPLSPPHHSLFVPAHLIFSAVIVFTVSFSHENAILPANSRPVLILRRDLLIKKVPVARCLLDGLSPARDGWNTPRRGCAPRNAFDFACQVFFPSLFVRDREERDRESNYFT